MVSETQSHGGRKYDSVDQVFRPARLVQSRRSIQAFLKLKVTAKLGDVTLRRGAEMLFILAAKI